MTAEEFTLRDVEPQGGPVPDAVQVSQGMPIPVVARLGLMSADEWEQFTEEWVTHLKHQGEYVFVRRSGGAGDRGLDVVAFTSELGFGAAWDSYQCKHYADVLGPDDICTEAAKIVYHSFNRNPPFNQTCRIPRRHVFVSPKGTGTKAGRWLMDPEEFRRELKERWEKCAPKVGGRRPKLEGVLLAYVDGFDFGIFGDRSGVELVEEHAKTPFHTARFGGGLPPRDEVSPPPAEPSENESVYLRKLLDAYEDHLGSGVATAIDLDADAAIRNHYNRQRVLFYSAESLRNFARDRTPEGTFDSFRDDVYHGVVDVYEEEHDSGLARVRATVGRAAMIDVGGNALARSAHTADKQGVCHQLANDDVLTWVRNDGE